MSLNKLVREVSKKYSKIISREVLRKYDKLNWGDNGIGDRWCNKKFNYSVIYASGKVKNYSENLDDEIPKEKLEYFLKEETTEKGIIGIYVYSKRKNIERRPIRQDIKNLIYKNSCVVCGSKENIICDHKNDLYNDERVLNIKTQTVEDFQALCNHCNLQKRQVCKKEKETNKIYVGRNLEKYKNLKFELPDDKKLYDVKDVNCKKDTYWYDPVEYDKKVKELYYRYRCKNIDKEECGNVIMRKSDFKDIKIKNMNGIELLESLDNNSIDLVLTDPPYIISRKSGMDEHYKKVKENEKNKIEFVKTEKEWEKYKKENKLEDDKKKDNYMRYGTIYGKKYCVKTDYGEWDKNFSMDDLENFVKLFYKKLRKGGTCIIWFDLWKIGELKELLEKNKFKQIRFIEWIKTNPQPLNSKTNYLTNCREIAVLCVKGGKPIFNSKYDNGIYSYPLQGGKDRFHPTQKSLKLFEDIIMKHSEENALVVDPFLGSGTTAFACLNTNRKFVGSELCEEYYEKTMKIYKRKKEENKKTGSKKIAL